jgi:uncharacterized SAM-binding protein YcdF (DUF218 family)
MIFNQVMKKWLKILIYFLIAFASWVPLAWLLADYLIVEKPLKKVDAILVLAGSESYIERCWEAAVNFKKGIAPKIILTNDGIQGGWNQKEQRNPYFVESARLELINRGVPENAIETLETVVRGTNEEADLMVQIVASRELKSLLLVTSDYHSRRALWTFKRAMSRNNLSPEIGIISPRGGYSTLSRSSWWTTLAGYKIVGLEYTKIVYYWMLY